MGLSLSRSLRTYFLFQAAKNWTHPATRWGGGTGTVVVPLVPTCAPPARSDWFENYHRYHQRVFSPPPQTEKTPTKRTGKVTSKKKARCLRSIRSCAVDACTSTGCIISKSAHVMKQIASVRLLSFYLSRVSL